MSDDYGNWRLPQLWMMVAGETERNAAHHLQTLKRQQEALLAQHRRLGELRADLATKWPPDKSTAAAMFIDRLKGLTYAIEATAHGIGQIQENLRHITDALHQARTALKPLMEKYYDESAAWKAVNAKQFPMLPAQLSAGVATLPGLDNLVLRYYQHVLDEEARTIMRATDQTVVEATARMTGLPEYRRFDRTSDPEPERLDGIGSSVDYQFPALAAGTGRLSPPLFAPPLPVPPDVGPLLAGAESPISTNRESLRADGSAVDALGMSDPNGVSGGSASIPRGRFSTRTPSGQATMRPGGVIGGMPVASVQHGDVHNPGLLPPAGLSGAAGRDVTRARQGSQPRPASLGHEFHRVHPFGQLAVEGWRDRSFEDYAERRRHRNQERIDDPWNVEEGVTPLFDAPKIETRHDPGPGVIGLDR